MLHYEKSSRETTAGRFGRSYHLCPKSRLRSRGFEPSRGVRRFRGPYLVTQFCRVRPRGFELQHGVPLGCRTPSLVLNRDAQLTSATKSELANLLIASSFIPFGRRVPLS